MGPHSEGNCQGDLFTGPGGGAGDGDTGAGVVSEEADGVAVHHTVN